MKNKKHIFTLLAFIFCLNIFAKDKLITIYDKDCGFCQDLLNETYQNELVKDKLNIYEHLLFESKTQKGIEYIKKYNITSYPTQIVITNGKTIVLKGFLNFEKQIDFLKSPFSFKNADSNNTFAVNLIPLSKKRKSDSLLVIPKRHHRRVCGDIHRAFRNAQEPLDAYLKSLQIIIDRVDLKVKKNDFLNFAYKHFALITCENKDGVKMRKFNTILKYTIDTKNYDFIRNVLFIKENGKNVCNPYIDFTRKEIIEGEEESLRNFIDKILNEEGMSAVYDFATIRSLRDLIIHCEKNKITSE